MKRQRSIFILGAGVMQIPALRLARAQGWRVVVADGNADAAARPLADQFVQIDLRDRESLAAFARSYHEVIGLDGVFTAGTDFSTSVAYVAEALDLPGTGYQVALDASDKQRMRTRFAQHAVPSPRFYVLDRTPSARIVARISEEIGFPAVVKPVDNMGARGVRCVENAELLPEAVEEAIAFSAARRALVEQFVVGPEFSIDAVVCSGELIVCGVADRDIRFPPYFIETGHTMPTSVDERSLRELIEAFRRAVAALRINNGAAKGDVFLGPRGPVIGEIAARLSGGYMSGWTYPLASGAEPTLAAMQIALGEQPTRLEPRWHKVSVERAVLSIPGTIRSILGFDQARRGDNIYEVFQRCEVGQQVMFPRNNVEKCGNVISCAADRPAATEAALRALCRIEIRLVAGEPRTIEFLWGGDDRVVTAFPGLQRVLAAEGAAARLPLEPASLSGTVDLGECDWNGRPLGRTLDILRPERFLQRHISCINRSVFGGWFWPAIAKGGLQGGRFLFDTIRETPNWRERLPAS